MEKQMYQRLGSLFLSMTMLAGCNMDALTGQSKDKNQAADATGSEFALTGSLCGTFSYFNGFVSGKTKQGRRISMTASLGVCGKQSGVEWKALAASHEAEDVSVRVGETEGKSPIYLDEKRAVHLRRPDGEMVRIGSAHSTAEGAPIKLAKGVSLKVLVEGEPFRLDLHSKSSPGKSLLFTLAD